MYGKYCLEIWEYLGLLGILLELGHHMFLVIGNFIKGHECIFVDTEIMLLQVTDVPVRGHNLVILSQELLYRLGLSRRLYDNQIFLHISFFGVENSGAKLQKKVELHLIIYIKKR